jgi:hypothetical protein
VIAADSGNSNDVRLFYNGGSDSTFSMPPGQAPPANLDSTSIEITFTKFQPMTGTPGQEGYIKPKLSYRITASGSKSVDFPVINFSVESAPFSDSQSVTSGGAATHPSQKLFQREFAPPGGTPRLDPGKPVDFFVSLDPVSDVNWWLAYDKTDKAKFRWSIEGKSDGAVDMPVHSAWP